MWLSINLMKSFYLTAFKIIIVTFQKPRSLGYFPNQGPTSRSTLKIHFVNSQDRNFILTQSAGSFQGTNLRNCEDFKWAMIFYQWRWWKENWREEKSQKGMFYNCPYQQMLQTTKVKYEGDLLLLPSGLLSSTCTRICHKPACDLRTQGMLLKEDTVCKLSVSAAFLLSHSSMVEYKYWVPAILSSAKTYNLIWS